jgi:NAD+ diphosphatase
MLSPQTYAGGRLDRADALRRDDAAVRAALADRRARFLLLDDLRPLMRPDGADIQWLGRDEAGDSDPVFLGLDPEGIPHFAVAGSAAGLPGVAMDARRIGMALGPDPLCATIAAARSLLDWHDRHRFCARCGAVTAMNKAGWSRSCGACGAEHFPRVDPVVIMLAVHGDQALVGRSAGFPPGRFSALAGFVEPGESLEEAVARELFEEAGVRVGSIRYLGSQPWPFPSSLMLGAVAEACSLDLVIDREELEDARWVSRAEVALALKGQADWQAPPPFAIAHALLRAWTEPGPSSD